MDQFAKQNKHRHYSINTNQVILTKDSGGYTTYFFPCYIRFLAKQIDFVDIENMEAKIIGTMIFSFYYGQTPRDKIDQFIGPQAQKYIVLQYNLDESLELKQEKGITMREDKDKKIIDFVVRKTYKLQLRGNMFLAPFNTLDMHLLVAVQSFFVGSQIFKFNCMDSKQVLVLFHGENVSFGNYQFATYFFDAKFTNKRNYPFEKDRQQIQSHSLYKDKDIQNFQYAHFKISIFQQTLTSILTVFIPLWLLGLVSIFIYFTDNKFGQRVEAISVLFLTYVSLISTLNSLIPPSPSIKFTEILILAQLISTVLLLIQSFQIRNIEKYQFIWYQNSCFQGIVLINVSTFIIILFFFVKNKCVQTPKYIRINEKDCKKTQQRNIEREKWRNQDCDAYFNQKFKREMENINI